MEHVRNFVKNFGDMLLIEGIINRCPDEMDTYVDATNPDNPEIHGFYINSASYKNKTHDELKGLPCYDQPKYKVQMLLNAVHGNPLKVGDKVKFDDEKNFRWTVRAVREEYSILTTSGEKGYYTIVDHIEGIRGRDNCYGVGYKTDEDCENAMLALFDEHPDGDQIEISYRHRIPLVISEVKHAGN